MSEADGPSFQELLRRARAGDADASAELVRRYEPSIRGAVRRPIDEMRLRSVLDSMDVCQDVLANFFARAGEGQFELSRPEQLLALLVTMARNRVRDEARRWRAGRRDVRKQASLSDDGMDVFADAGPTASRVAVGREEVEEVYRHLSAEEQLLLEQRAAGREWGELAEELKSTPAALRMKLTRALERVIREVGTG